MSAIINKILKDNLPGNSIVQSYHHSIKLCMEELVLKVLQDLHVFNMLNDVLIRRLSTSTGLDCRKMCEDNGITYNVKEK